MNTKTLEEQLIAIVKSGAGYGPEFLPVLEQSIALLNQINNSKPSAGQFFQLGVLLLELQDSNLALNAFQKAWEFDPLNLESATYVALLLEQLEQIDHAIQVYIKINEIDPKNTEIVSHVLQLMHGRNDTKGLLSLCQILLQREHQYAAVYYYMSQVFYSYGDYDKALGYIKHAAELESNNPNYVNRLIHHLYKMKYYKEVLGFADYLLQEENISLPIRLLLPNSYAAMGENVKARAEYIRLLNTAENKSDYFAILSEISLYHAMYDHNLAKANLINGYILRRDPDNVLALTNFAKFTGYPQKSLDNYKRVVQLQPNDHQSRLNYGLRLLEMGEFELGFELYESRVNVSMPHLVEEIRNPETLAGKSLFIWNEQGLGDQYLWSWLFQFLKSDGVKAKVQTDPRLVSLMARSFPDIEFIGLDSLAIYQNEPLADFDGTLMMASLGRYYHPQISRAQSDHGQNNAVQGHLKADPELISHWKSKISHLNTSKCIGVCWRSSLVENYRSLYYLSATDIADIFKDTDYTIINLQYSYSEQEIDLLQNVLGDRFVNLPGIDLKDEQDSLAALIMALDGVFSVNTAVNALSGALGQITFSPNGCSFLGKDFNVMLAGTKSIYKRGGLSNNLDHYRSAINNYFN